MTIAKEKMSGSLPHSPPLQDFWRSPSRGVGVLECVALHGTWVFSECGKAKIRDACVTRVIHQDVSLAERQHDSGARSGTVTHSLEIPVNHIACVEVAESLSDIGYLVTNVSMG